LVHLRSLREICRGVFVPRLGRLLDGDIAAAEATLASTRAPRAPNRAPSAPVPCAGITDDFPPVCPERDRQRGSHSGLRREHSGAIAGFPRRDDDKSRSSFFL